MGRRQWLNDENRPVSVRDHLDAPEWLEMPEDVRQWFGPSGVIVPLHAEGRHLGAVLLAFAEDYPLADEMADFLMAAGRVLGAFLEGHRLRAKEHELAVLDERRRLADELHARVSQDVAAMGLALSTLRLDGEPGTRRTDLLKQDVDRLETLVSTMGRDLRTQMLGLHQDAEIGRTGLFDQARCCTDAFTRRCGVPVAVEATGNDREVPLASASAVLRALLEALNQEDLRARPRDTRRDADGVRAGRGPVPGASMRCVEVPRQG